jgi:hypothetical protein
MTGEQSEMTFQNGDGRGKSAKSISLSEGFFSFIPLAQ